MINVLSPGLLTTVQDGGRVGWQRFGVPVCGAMDNYSLRLANRLVDNAPEEAALEVTMLGPRLRFEEPCVVAFAGGDFPLTLNGVSVGRGQAIAVKNGDELEIGAAARGVRGYLAVSGGFDLPEVLGSRSTYVRGGFGGYEGRKLRSGDDLPLRAPAVWLQDMASRRADPWLLDAPLQDRPIRVVLGPQNDVLSREGLDAFFYGEYTVTAESDRMGCRLKGPAVSFREGLDANIISDGVAMGSIQVPSGMPIVMMADRQTTGGYAKLGAVITADLPLMAQKRPGDMIRFDRVTPEEAAVALRRMRRKLENPDFLHEIW